MTNNQKAFIEKIASLALEDYKTSRILPSITIAQAILESGWGTTVLATEANNLFGMKCYLSGNTWDSVWDGISAYNKETKEEYTEGNITLIKSDFRKYPDIKYSVMDHSLYLRGAKSGSSFRYKGLTETTSYKKQIEIIKNGGYATDSQYVSKICNIITTYDLEKYDRISGIEEVIQMSNSKLVDCVVKSPNHSGKRTHSIDRITPHCVVGQLSAESIGNCFPAGRGASCNYGIGKDGRVCLIVDEANRSWCSSSNANDQRAITIECASDMSEPYTMNNAVYEKLVKLCADICQRNGKTKLLWFADKNKSLNYSPKSDEMIITVHRWFANKSCPGNWLYSRLGDLANRVNKILGSSSNPSTPSTSELYRVRKSWTDAASQIGAYAVLDNAKAACKTGYKVYNSKGVQVWPVEAAKDNLYRVRKSWTDAGSQIGAYSVLDNAKAACKEGYSVFDSKGNKVYSKPAGFKSYTVKITTNALNIRKGPGTNYGINGCIRDMGVYTIVEEKAGWGRLKSGAGWISLAYTKKI